MTTPHTLERLLTALVLGPVLALAGGCGLKARPPLAPSTLPDEVRERLGRTGVATVAFAPEVTLAGPIPLGSVAGGVTGGLAGLGLGALGGAGCLVSYGRWVEGCGLLLSTPYFMARWSIEGARNAVPEGERRHGRDAIVRAAAEMSQARLLEAVLAEGRSRKEPAPELVPAQGPGSVGERSRYRDAVTGDLDTVVEIALVRVSLDRDATIGGHVNPWTYSFMSPVNPALCMVAEARLRLVTVADDAVLFEKPFAWHAPCARFSDWAKDEAAEFRRAGDEAIASFGRWIADHVAGLKGAAMDAPPSNEEPAEPQCPTPQGGRE